MQGAELTSADDSSLPEARRPDAINSLPPRARKHAVLERRRQVWELRLSGLTYIKIAKLIGISESAVKVHVQKQLAKIQGETQMNAAAWRAMEIERIDAIVARLWPKRDDPRVADSVLRCMERRAKLLGLDAQEKVAVDMRKGDDLQTVQAKFDAAKLTTQQLAQLESILQDALVPLDQQPVLQALPAPVE
jgi:DNA-binding CsgD family transcriptional regulator